MRRRAAIRLLLAAGCVLGVLLPADAGASEPSVILDVAEAAVGQNVVVTIDGFTGTAATLMICGNLALRGSTDCDLPHAIGVGFARSGTTSTDLRVRLPPTPCPCVVRAAGVTDTQVRTVPLTILGAPSAPTAAPPAIQRLVRVSVRARSVRASLLDRGRASLGGRARRAVEVTVVNATDAPVSRLAISSAFGPAGEPLQPVAAPDIAPLAPRERRSYTLTTTVRPAAAGQFRWEVAIYGAGTADEQRLSIRVVPWGLVLAMVVLIVDLSVFAAVRIRRRASPRPSV